MLMLINHELLNNNNAYIKEYCHSRDVSNSWNPSVLRTFISSQIRSALSLNGIRQSTRVYSCTVWRQTVNNCTRKISPGSVLTLATEVRKKTSNVHSCFSKPLPFFFLFRCSVVKQGNYPLSKQANQAIHSLITVKPDEDLCLRWSNKANTHSTSKLTKPFPHQCQWPLSSSLVPLNSDHHRHHQTGNRVRAVSPKPVQQDKAQNAHKIVLLSNKVWNQIYHIHSFCDALSNKV